MSIIFYDTVNDLRLDGKLCDALIVVDDVVFKVHRIVLCNCSSYFRDLFCSKSSTSAEQIYTFFQVSPDIMTHIVEYAYTGSVSVKEDSVLELLAGADHFAIRGLMQACCDILERRLSVNNCVHICLLADFHRCPGLRRKAYVYILQNFEEVAERSVEFLHLSAQQLADLIEKDELNVRQESAAFEAVLLWMNYAPEGRRGYLASLLSKVRLLLMPDEYLANVVSTNALVRKSPTCVTMVDDAMKILREPQTARPLTRTRLPSAVILAIGGWENDSPTNRIELYDVRADRWLSVNNRVGGPRAFHGCVFLNGCIYYVGGFDGENYLSSVRKLNLVTQTWKRVRPMHAVRCYVSVVALNGCIYAIGGCDGRAKLRSTERYHLDSRQWALIAPMHEQRSNASAATLHGKVYICGGFSRNESLSSAECYNPHTDQWTLIAPMGSGCNAARAVAYKDRIYVVGGYRDNSQSGRVVTYDPQSNRWSTVTPMIHPRCSFGIAVLEDQLYAAGGFDSLGTIREVERYDDTTSRWQVVCGMETPRSGLRCCVVARQPYADAYLS